MALHERSEFSGAVIEVKPDDETVCKHHHYASWCSECKAEAADARRRAADARVSAYEDAEAEAKLSGDKEAQHLAAANLAWENAKLEAERVDARSNDLWIGSIERAIRKQEAAIAYARAGIAYQALLLATIPKTIREYEARIAESEAIRASLKCEDGQ